MNVDDVCDGSGLQIPEVLVSPCEVTQAIAAVRAKNADSAAKPYPVGHQHRDHLFGRHVVSRVAARLAFVFQLYQDKVVAVVENRCRILEPARVEGEEAGFTI